METATKLSANAQKLYDFLKKFGHQWEGKCLDELYPPVKFSLENIKAHYEDQAKRYGTDHSYFENGVEIKIKGCGHAESYARQLSTAYQELKKLGMAGERNNGYNDYVFFAI